MSKRRRKHNDLWVARDGVWGVGGVTLFDTEEWSEKDWAIFEQASDEHRHSVAKVLSRKYELKRDWRYGLSLEQLVRALRAEELRNSDGFDVRAYIIDEDGVTEIDPDKGE